MGKPKKKDLPDLSDLARPGAEIEVRVTPKAARNSLQRGAEGIRIHVTAAPEGGKANRAVQEMLAAAMGVAPSHLQLARGQTARAKLFVYSGS
jgi:uncharacterized protein YggU (UPF0235/DUF167 family)